MSRCDIDKVERIECRLMVTIMWKLFGVFCRVSFCGLVCVRVKDINVQRRLRYILDKMVVVCVNTFSAVCLPL